MSLWFVFALMTAAAVFAVLWPLGRRTASKRGGAESAVYKDQLAEVDRDLETGIIQAPEAAAARAEIGRRLIAAADAETHAPTGSSRGARRAVSVVALLGLPLLAISIYWSLGSPQLPDLPLASRARQPVASASLDTLVAQVEAHLEKNPSDVRGWQVLAPVLMKLGRYDDAARAVRNTITYGGETAERRADLGEAIAAAANGVVTEQAKGEFERAVALSAGEVKARYFLGLAAEQDGRLADAAAAWRAMLAGAPSDAPWRPLVEAALARVGGPPIAAVPDGQAAAADQMPQGDQAAMIQRMVERLAERLKANGRDVSGWLRLVRAYMVLGDADKSHAAVTNARRAVGDDKDLLKQLNDGLKELGIVE
ncbi:MAG: c-type cytochrome biogenesis protein CcmI [Xanthobacteraceae bacterium]